MGEVEVPIKTDTDAFDECGSTQVTEKTEDGTMGLLDKAFGIDEKAKQLKQEVKSLELRREAAFAAINNEIGRLQGERSNVFLQAGAAAYNTWCKDKTQADLTQFWARVTELEKSIAEQEAKKVEMGAKYDEEIRLINSNLGIGTAVSGGAVPGGAVSSGAVSGGVVPGATGRRCAKCGNVLDAGSLFCTECGTKVE
ncbi:MAG: zinc ribbon domain-containing protein [Bacteroidales bacterium]|nr:zinc ribbon domain-containing protein [Lachnoclostridium sp.]MCM1382980.1 zinc ribbon domain-containing protein [Lachnoclostridium sp.]MCM1463966.1 zinc ribbon domain-containing protein [Bacteroidales bacterium]